MYLYHSMNVGEQNLKSNSKKFLILLFLVLLSILLIFIYFFVVKNPSLDDNVGTSLNTVEDASVFEGLVSPKEQEDPSNIYRPEVNKSLDRYWSYLSKTYQYPEDSWNDILEENQVVLKASEDTSGKISYKFIFSKNPDFQFDSGSDIDFNPSVILPDYLILREADKVHFSYESEDFNDLESDIIRSGDLLIFICNKPDCSDGSLDWLLVKR